MRVAIGQINTTVGDIDGNADLMIEQIEAARDQEAALLVFPEMSLFGYPPKDLVRRDQLVKQNLAALDRVASRCRGIACVVGYARSDPTGEGTGVFNAAAFCEDGRVRSSYAKMLLPDYDVFDESRYFNAGASSTIVQVKSGALTKRVGLTICEDLFNDRQFGGRTVYGTDPVQLAVQAGAEVIVNMSGSPFAVGKQADRESVFATQAKAHGVALIYVNQVAGNDDLVFDGASLILNSNGDVIARARAFETQLLVADLHGSSADSIHEYPDRIESIRSALVLGIKDYVRKCGFGKVVIGLSGGIDSAVTASLAVEALGAGNVVGVALPSRHSSDHSLRDARKLASLLDIELMTISIDAAHRAHEEALAEQFKGTVPGVAEENLQARIRGNILMALCNKFGWLLLSTGNKSELAVGYCTLYGDMSGGLAVLSDVPKTMVYQLAQRINESELRIPIETIQKDPSAELRPDQRDSDSLPPYEQLDPILEAYVERDESVDAIAATGIDRSIVESVVRMVDRNEYKRRQAAIGIKVTSRAFGVGRRMPVAAHFRA